RRAAVGVGLVGLRDDRTAEGKVVAVHPHGERRLTPRELGRLGFRGEPDQALDGEAHQLARRAGLPKLPRGLATEEPGMAVVDRVEVERPLAPREVEEVLEVEGGRELL